MENTTWGGKLRDKWTTRQSWMLYLSRDTPQVLYFCTNMISGDVLSGILYFELLPSCIIVYTASNNACWHCAKPKVVWLCETKLSDGFFEWCAKRMKEILIPSLLKTSSRCELEQLKFWLWNGNAGQTDQCGGI